MNKLFMMLAICFLAHGSWNIVKHWDMNFEERIKNMNELITIDSTKMEKHLISAIDENDLEHAENIISIAKTLNMDIDFMYYDAKIIEADNFINNQSANLLSIYDGFVTGKGKDTLGISAAIASDFFVIGDIRTLHTELQKSSADRSEIDIALSSFGIALTAGTVATAGGLSPGKFWVSFFKTARKTKMLSSKLTKNLVNTIKKALNFKAVKSGKLKNVFNVKALRLLTTKLDSLNTAYKSIGSMGGAMKALKFMNHTNDFKKLGRLSSKYKKLTPTILALSGRAALKTKKILVFGTKLIISIIEIAISLLFMLYIIIKILFRSTKTVVKIAT